MLSPKDVYVKLYNDLYYDHYEECVNTGMSDSKAERLAENYANKNIKQACEMYLLERDW